MLTSEEQTVMLIFGSMSYLLNLFEPRSEETVKIHSFDPVTRRSFYKGSAINYNIDLLFNEQLNHPHRIASADLKKE